MGLGMLVGRGRFDEPAVPVVDVIMALARPIDAIGPVQPGVEPLRRIGRGLLGRQHVAKLVMESPRIGLAVEIAGLPAPIGPGSGQPVEHLLGRAFAAVPASFAASSGLWRHSHSGTPSSGTGLSATGTPALRKYFCASTSLATWLQALGHFDVGLLENDRAVGVSDFARGGSERDALVGRLTFHRELTPNTHGLPRQA